MARAPLLQLAGVALAYGGDAGARRVDLAVQEGERIALVGRNGAGKSTLLKVMAGLVLPDRGERTVPAGTAAATCSRIPTCPPSRPSATRHRRPGACEGCASPRRRKGWGSTRAGPSPTQRRASGGAPRWLRLLAAEPELMLLDEPTNHLDIAAIAWLEARLAEPAPAFVLISHDRAFLRRLTRGDAVDGPRRGAPAWTGASTPRGVARRGLGRGGRGAPQAGPQDRAEGELGGRGHLGPAQAQPGPGAGAGRDAGGAARAGSAARHRRPSRRCAQSAAAIGAGGVIRRHGGSPKRLSRPRLMVLRPQPAASCAATGWRWSARTGPARRRW